MVIEEIWQGKQCIRLLPNRSANWQQTKLLVCFVGSVSLGVGLFWAWQGAWLILPFAGIEVALLVFLAHKVCSATYQQQMITFEQNAIVIESGMYFPRHHWRLDRQSAALIVTEPEHPLSPLHLQLADMNERVELGYWLNREDTLLLLPMLKQQGLPVRAYGKAAAVAV